MALKTDKSIFYYVPRTGGQFVGRIISQMDAKKKVAKHITDSSPSVRKSDYTKYTFGLFNKHTAPNGLIKENEEKLFSYCFVRHPIEWYKSLWCTRMDRDGDIDHRFTLKDCWSHSFEEFVDNSSRKFPKGFLTQMYAYFVTSVDFVGRQENLREDLIKALTLAGEEFDANVIRATAPVNCSSERKNGLKLSKKLEKRVLESEHWIIDNFYTYNK